MAADGNSPASKRSSQRQSDLADRVAHQLYWNPSIDSAAIAVSAAADGTVTIRGTVGGPTERRWVTEAVGRVAGVRSIDDRLEVHPLTRHGRSDAEQRGRVLQALMLSAIVPDTVDAYATRGFITLTGTVLRQPVRDEAERIARSVPGVTGLLDEIVLEEPDPTPDELQQETGEVLARLAAMGMGDLDVEVASGTVTLTGVVTSQARHREAIAFARGIPGVVKVIDRIRVGTAPARPASAEARD